MASAPTVVRGPSLPASRTMIVHSADGTRLHTEVFGPADGAPIVLAQSKPEIDGVLKAYAAAWSERTGIQLTIKSCGGDNCRLGDQLRADYAAGDMPDIWNISGIEDYKEWQALIRDLSNEKWVNETVLEFIVDGKVEG